jgi:hypothetical protein
MVAHRITPGESSDDPAMVASMACTGVDFTGLTNPVTVGVTIGIDSGSTTVTAQF